MTVSRRRRTAVLGALPILLGALSCETGGSGTAAPAPGAAVFSLPPAQQLRAAAEATRRAGTATFVGTLALSSAAGTAVEHTTGAMDFAESRSRAEVSLEVAGAFPEDAAAALGGGREAPGPLSLATDGGDVFARGEDSAWLRFTPGAVEEFGGAVAAFSEHSASPAAPYGGTLADLVPSAVAERAPEERADGSRRYRVTVPARTAAKALPAALRPGTAERGGEQVPLTVELDGLGRITRVDADFGPLLAALRQEGLPEGVTDVRGTLELGALGEPTAYRLPGRDGAGVEDARKVLTPLREFAAGSCAAREPVLAAAPLTRASPLRTADCDAAHDLRVLARFGPGEPPAGQHPVGGAESATRCAGALARAPEEWRREARRDGAALVVAVEPPAAAARPGAAGTGGTTGGTTCVVGRV
ncbi:hypothetical protein [Streptomyces sp. C10-9-1]|uniref:hypothetical protein n=1 Tax=Streptomyces sp. C10-9-1 TaxID=1859285 RepID=UPI003F4A82BA